MNDKEFRIAIAFERRCSFVSSPGGGVSQEILALMGAAATLRSAVEV